MDLRSIVRECLVGREDGGDRAVLDLDQRACLGSRLRRRCHDQGNGVTHLADPGLHEDRLVLQPAPVAVQSRDVTRGQDRLDARHQASALRVDAHDIGVGMRAAEGLRMQHPVNLEVCRVEGAARRLVQRIPARVPGRFEGPRHAPCDGSRRPLARRALLAVGHPFDGIQDALIARAAAEVAAQPAADLAPTGPGVALQQRGGGHDHAGRAEPALDGIGRRKCLLEGMRMLRAPEAFDGQDILPGHLAHGRPTGAHDLPVDHDDAGPAGAVIAAFLGPSQAEVLADGVEQPPLRRDVEAAWDAVHHQGHARLPVHVATPAAVLGRPVARTGSLRRPWFVRAMHLTRTQVRVADPPAWYARM